MYLLLKELSSHSDLFAIDKIKYDESFDKVASHLVTPLIFEMNYASAGASVVNGSTTSSL